MSYDVFISYSHHDAEWVRGTLKPYLEQHNFSVFIDYINFRGGSFSIDEMQRGIEASRRIIAVLTPDYVQSEWSNFEATMAQSLDPAAINRVLIPVLRQDCVIPLRLKILHYRNLQTDAQEQWEMLIRDLI